MFGHSHATFEVSTKAAIYNEAGTKVLVMMYNRGTSYGLPGGHLDLNETPLEGMQRELNEELGVDYDFQLTPQEFFVHDSNKKFPRLILGYTGQATEDLTFVFTSQDIVEEAMWIDRNAFATTPITACYRTFIEAHWPVV